MKLGFVLMTSVCLLLIGVLHLEREEMEPPVHSSETLEVIHTNDSTFVLEDGEEYYYDRHWYITGDSVTLHYYRGSLVKAQLQYNIISNKSYK